MISNRLHLRKHIVATGKILWNSRAGSALMKTGRKTDDPIFNETG